MPINLTRLDTPPLQDVEFVYQFENWLSNIVDAINYDLQLIEDELASLDARVTALGG